ncbi:MAG: prepilin-type N-terminal cleavage/methylation domain-containing protein [Candidatus Gracilibacteria bacterium]|nr:prepilin-type N-terminal cleavage/methylation domain-containing protein [Candidatus Gracilibacteria bacterium]
MKKKILAFTMIELLVVVSIISIISITSINGFFNFLQDKELKTKTITILNYIGELDKKIKNNSIYDYDIKFSSSINDAYLIYENIYDNDQYVKLFYNNNLGSLILSGLNGEMWNLLIYKGNKLKIKEDLIINSYNNIIIEDEYDYKFLSVLSGSTNNTNLNSIDLIKFDKESNKLKLLKISNSIGGTDIGNLEIKNIGGKKEFYNSGSILNQNEVYLYFENTGLENYLKITK